MTRTEFYDEITTWGELIDFCNDNNLSVCEDVYDGYDVNDRIEDDLREYVRDYGWEAVRNALNGIREIDDGEYYHEDGAFDYTVLDDGDFQNYKNDAAEQMDRTDEWDDEEEESEEFEEPRRVYIPDPEDQIPVEEEPIPIAQLWTVSNSDLAKLVSQKKEAEDKLHEEIDKEFEDFLIDAFEDI